MIVEGFLFCVGKYIEKYYMGNSDYISKIFNKDSENITLDIIRDFFSTPQEETSVLEFKSGGVEIIDIYKEITAFLNTEGGLLIIGAPREKRKKINKNEITICEGELTYSNFKNKDWIYQKIASNITPTPINLAIKEFISEDGGVFLIDVPQSTNPPHQSSADGKYYIRLEREAKPAPHGIVQALFDKRKVPKIISEIEIESSDDLRDKISIYIRNRSIIPADKVSYKVEVFNVNNIRSDLNFHLVENNLGSRYTMSYNTNEVLVQIIHFQIDFDVFHRNEDYLIIVAYWSKELDICMDYIVFNPVEKIIKREGDLESGNVLSEIEKFNHL